MQLIYEVYLWILLLYKNYQWDQFQILMHGTRYVSKYVSSLHRRDDGQQLFRLECCWDNGFTPSRGVTGVSTAPARNSKRAATRKPGARSKDESTETKRRVRRRLPTETRLITVPPYL